VNLAASSHHNTSVSTSKAAMVAAAVAANTVQHIGRPIGDTSKPPPLMGSSITSLTGAFKPVVSPRHPLPTGNRQLSSKDGPVAQTGDNGGMDHMNEVSEHMRMLRQLQPPQPHAASLNRYDSTNPNSSLYRSPSDAAHLLVKKTSGQGVSMPLSCLDCGNEMPCACTGHSKAPADQEATPVSVNFREGFPSYLDLSLPSQGFDQTHSDAEGSTEEKRAKLISLLGDTFQHVWHICKHLEYETLEEMTKRTCAVLQCALQDIDSK